MSSSGDCNPPPKAIVPSVLSFPFLGMLGHFSGRSRPKGRVSVSHPQASHVRPLVMWEPKSFKYNNRFSSGGISLGKCFGLYVTLIHACHVRLSLQVCGREGEDITASWDLSHVISAYICQNIQIPFVVVHILWTTWLSNNVIKSWVFLLEGYFYHLNLGGCWPGIKSAWQHHRSLGMSSAEILLSQLMLVTQLFPNV